MHAKDDIGADNRKDIEVDDEGMLLQVDGDGITSRVALQVLAIANEDLQWSGGSTG